MFPSIIHPGSTVVPWGTVPDYFLRLPQAHCAWGITEGNPDVIIGVVDTEFDLFHPDLIGKFEGIYNFHTPASDAYHGTAVSSCIVAEHNNFGTAGVGRNLRVRGYQVGNGKTTSELIITAYEQGIKVINLSYQGTSSTPHFIDAVEEMTQNGTTLVVCAGNIAGSSDGHSHLAHIPGVIIVSGHDWDGNIRTTNQEYHFSTDLVAPSINVLTCTGNPFYTNGYNFSTGTSFASPLVAGTVGLMLSVNPCLSPKEIEELLKASCLPISDPTVFPGLYGAGRLNVLGAVQAAQSYNSNNVILTNDIWVDDRTIFGDVIVKTGVTLTIKGKIQMSCSSKIIVEPNAKLIVDGGHITKTKYGPKWHGIEVAGDISKSSNASYHGTVEIKNNAIIEFARNGVRNFVESNYNGGGIIRVSNSKFLNCVRAVELNNYPDHTYNTSSGSNCSFKNVTFIMDNEEALYSLSGNRVEPNFITSWNTYSGIEIKDCTFKIDLDNTEIADDERGVAILMVSSGANIKSNEIEGFVKGIFVEGEYGLPSRTTRIVNNTLNNNNTGIFTSISSFTLIKKNVINNNDSRYIRGLENRKSGIYLYESNNTTVDCDNIVNVPNDIRETFGLITYYRYLENSNTIVKGNSFETKIGVHAQGHNPQTHVVCNNFETTNRGLSVMPIYTYNQFHDQGTGCGITNYRAGNEFSGEGYDLYLDRNIGPGSRMQDWTYYAFSNDDNQKIINAYTTEDDMQWENCVFSSISTDPTSRCLGSSSPFLICSSEDFVLNPVEVGDLVILFNQQVSIGKRYEIETKLLFGMIVRGYNDIGNKTELIEFLENDIDTESKKLLIPLYIEQGLFNEAVTTISNLAMSQYQKNKYFEFYNVINDLKADNKWNNLLLSNSQKSILLNMENDTILNVAAYAQVLLNRANEVELNYPIITDVDFGQVISNNFDNVKVHNNVSEILSLHPNPVNDIFSVNLKIIEEDFLLGAELIITNIMGKEMYKLPLHSNIENLILSKSKIGLNSGLYLVSLKIGGRVHQSVKFSIL